MPDGLTPRLVIDDVFSRAVKAARVPATTVLHRPTAAPVVVPQTPIPKSVTNRLRALRFFICRCASRRPFACCQQAVLQVFWARFISVRALCVFLLHPNFWVGVTVSTKFAEDKKGPCQEDKRERKGVTMGRYT